MPHQVAHVKRVFGKSFGLFHGEALNWDQSTWAASNTQAPFFPILAVENISAVLLESSALFVIKKMRDFMLDNLNKKRGRI